MKNILHTVQERLVPQAQTSASQSSAQATHFKVRIREDPDVSHSFKIGQALTFLPYEKK